MNQANFPHQHGEINKTRTVRKADSATLTNEEVNHTLLVTTKATANTQTVPTASAANDGHEFRCLNAGAGDVTLTDGVKTQNVAHDEQGFGICAEVSSGSYEWFFTGADSSGTTD